MKNVYSEDICALRRVISAVLNLSQIVLVQHRCLVGVVTPVAIAMMLQSHKQI